MTSLNHIELPVRINHKQAHGSDCRDSFLRRTSSDSGTGSADKEDEDISQNGEMGTLGSARKNELSGDEKNKYMQNNSRCRSVQCSGIRQIKVSDKSSLSNSFSRSVPCNEIGQDKVADTNSSSNCSGSSCGLQQLGRRIERQDRVDIPPSEDNKENFFQIPTVIPSCDSQDHEENFLQTPPVIPLCIPQDIGGNVLQTVPLIPPCNPKTITDDLLQTPPLNSSCRNNTSEKQCSNFSNHSAGTLKSPADDINTYEDVPEKQQNDNINHSHPTIKDNDKIQILAHMLQSRASPCEPQNTICEVSEISATGLSQDSIARCLSAPTSSAKMPYRPPESRSLLVSPIDLVPKHIMDNLDRELNRERCRVKMLQRDNKNLHMTVNKLEGRCQTVALKYDAVTTRFKEELTLQEKTILLLKNNADVWQRKFNEKDMELSTAHQLLNDSNVRCQHLEDQIKILKATILKEEHNNKTLNDSYSNLARTLGKERARFDRDDRCLKEKIENLKNENQWLKDELAEHVESSMPVTSKLGRDLRVSIRSHTHTESGVLQSNETQLKGVYPENTVCQAQITLPKQKAKKPNGYKTHHTSPELECTKAATQERNPHDVKECSYCYRKASEFNSWEEFMDHIGRCEQ